MKWEDIKNGYRKWPINIYGYSKKSEDFRVKIGDGASIGDGARIGDRASIGDGASIGYGARIGDGASVGEGARIDKSLTYIIGSMHQIFLYDPAKKLIGIGCKVHTVSTWIDTYIHVGTQSGYTDAQIVEYKRYIDLFAESLTKEKSKWEIIHNTVNVVHHKYIEF